MVDEEEGGGGGGQHTAHRLHIRQAEAFLHTHDDVNLIIAAVAINDSLTF